MPSQFQGFCYETQAEAANADIATGMQSLASGIISPYSYTVINATTVSMTYKYKTVSSTAEANYIHSRVYPSCVSVGQVSNNSGVSVTDALTVSWLVVAVWALAFYFRTARIGVRGY